MMQLDVQDRIVLCKYPGPRGLIYPLFAFVYGASRQQKQKQSNGAFKRLQSGCPLLSNATMCSLNNRLKSRLGGVDSLHTIPSLDMKLLLRHQESHRNLTGEKLTIIYKRNHFFFLITKISFSKNVFSHCLHRAFLLVRS